MLRWSLMAGTNLSPPAGDLPPPNRLPQRWELAEAMPHIVWTFDAAGTSTYFNRRWTEYTGLDLEATLRVGSHPLVHPDDLPEVRRLFEQSRALGAPIETSYRLRRASDGAFRWHAARAVPLREVDRQVISWVGTAVDIDDQRRASDQQRFLVQASQVLGTSLDFARTLSDVARLVVPQLSDWCAVDLLNEEGRIERPAVAHVDPEKVELAWELWRRVPPRPEDEHGVYAVISGRAPPSSWRKSPTRCSPRPSPTSICSRSTERSA